MPRTHHAFPGPACKLFSCGRSGLLFRADRSNVPRAFLLTGCDAECGTWRTQPIARFVCDPQVFLFLPHSELKRYWGLAGRHPADNLECCVFAPLGDGRQCTHAQSSFQAVLDLPGTVTFSRLYICGLSESLGGQRAADWISQKVDEIVTDRASRSPRRVPDIVGVSRLTSAEMAQTEDSFGGGCVSN